MPTRTEAHTISVPTAAVTTAAPAPSSNTAPVVANPSSSTGATTVVTEKRGVGRFTVEEVALDAKIAADEAFARLEKLGVKAKLDEKLLALSGRSRYSPLDLDSIIRGKPLEPETTTK